MEGVFNILVRLEIDGVDDGKAREISSLRYKNGGSYIFENKDSNDVILLDVITMLRSDVEGTIDYLSESKTVEGIIWEQPSFRKEKYILRVEKSSVLLPEKGTEDIINCKVCKGTEGKIIIKQTSSIDEPMSTTVWCTRCGTRAY